MNTDEARINRFFGNYAHIIQVIIKPHVLRRYICVNPCPSVASNGF